MKLSFFLSQHTYNKLSRLRVCVRLFCFRSSIILILVRPLLSTAKRLKRREEHSERDSRETERERVCWKGTEGRRGTKNRREKEKDKEEEERQNVKGQRQTERGRPNPSRTKRKRGARNKMRDEGGEKKKTGIKVDELKPLLPQFTAALRLTDKMQWYCRALFEAVALSRKKKTHSTSSGR